MSSNQRWIVGEDTNSEQDNESDVGISKPLLRANTIPTKTPFLRMMFYGSIVAVPYVLAGMNLSFSSIALPQMNVGIDEASWLGSLSSFGSMFGSIVVGLIIDKYGRRPSFIFSITACIIGWTLLGISSNINVIFIGQFLAGIMPGCICIGQIYAAESIVVNNHHLRSSFSTWSALALAMGVVFDAVLGRLVSYQTTALIAVAIAITSLAGICIFIPESPHWLCQQGQIHRARLSEQQLYIHQPVLKNIDISQTSIVVDVKLTWKSVKKGFQNLQRRDVFKPLAILIVWDMFVVFSGGVCIIAYQVNILSDYPTNAPDTSTNTLIGYDLSIVSALFTLIAVALVSILVTYTGIKKLNIFSSIGMAIGMIGLAVSLGINEEYQAIQLWKSIHSISVWLILFFNSLGVCTIPSSVIGEMFPHDAKGFSTIPSLSFCLVSGILVKLHLYLYGNLGYLLYFIYAAASLVSVVFVQIFVPETVGKTQEEIREYYMR